MNRRGFLSRLPFLGAVAVLPAIEQIPGLTKVEDPSGYNYRYLGYKLHWTGWKYDLQSEDLAGQWLAASVDYVNGAGENYRDRRFLYANSGGRSGPYHRGDVFDMTVVDPSRRITWKSSEMDRKRVQRRTLQDMIELILSEK
jgi:hypothetical protein